MNDTQPPADEKLMPCPFCGYPPERATYDCGACGCEYHKCPLYRLKTTVEAWNRRATPPAAPAELDALRVLNNELRAQVERLTAKLIESEESERIALRNNEKLRAELAAVTRERDEALSELDDIDNALLDESDDTTAVATKRELRQLRGERDAARAELAALRAGAVTDSQVYQALKSLAYFKDSNGDVVATFGSMRAALQKVVGGWIKCSEQAPAECVDVDAIWWGGDRKMAHVRNGVWWYYGQMGIKDANVAPKFWRPLPPPPGEVTP
jgi:hypothetical protein